MTQQFTPAQLEAWAGCTAKYPEPITQDLWNQRVALFAEAKLHAPALARLVLEKEKEIARLKGQIQDIKECWDWWQEDTYDRCSTVVDDAIRQAMKETSDGLF